MVDNHYVLDIVGRLLVNIWRNCSINRWQLSHSWLAALVVLAIATGSVTAAISATAAVTATATATVTATATATVTATVTVAATASVTATATGAATGTATSGATRTDYAPTFATPTVRCGTLGALFRHEMHTEITRCL